MVEQSGERDQVPPAGPAPGERRRLKLARAALVLAAVVLALGLAEAGARLLVRTGRAGLPDPSVAQLARGAAPGPPVEASAAPPEPATAAGRPSWRDSRVLQRHPVIGYEHQPRVDLFRRQPEHAGGGFRFRTNGYGLRRDEEVAIPKPAGVFRVLVLGDSQTQGYGTNDEHYPARLEAALRARPGGERVEVLNAGVGGYGPQQYYLWYREHGVVLEPDLVLLGLYVGNDLQELMYLGRIGLAPSAIIDADAGRLSPWTAPDDWLVVHSRLYPLVRRAVTNSLLWAAVTKLGIVSPDPTPPSEVLSGLLAACQGCLFQHFYQAFYGRAEPARAERELARLETLFSLLEREVAARGGRLAVVTIPTKAQVEPDDARAEVGRVVRELELTEAHIAFNDLVRERALAAADRVGVPAVDPLPGLVEAAAGDRLYYRSDWHLNPTGNAVLGEILARALVAGRLVPVD